MAIDGPGLLENDAAQDFVEHVADGGGVAEVRRALRQILDGADDYLDADIAAEGWAAAELVAARGGEPRQRTGNEPGTYDDAIASIPVDPALIEDSLRALDRLQNEENNEMADLLADAGEEAAWHKLLADLRARLRRAQARHHLPAK